MKKLNIEELVMPQTLLIVGAAAETGMFDIFTQDAATKEGIAKAINADLRATWTLCEALVSLGYLEKNGEIYNLSPEAKDMFFNEASPTYTGFSFMHAYQLTKVWSNLPETIKTGLPVKNKPRDVKHFMNAMSHYAEKIAPEIAPLILQGNLKNKEILDIGGGPGIYAREFAKLGAKVVILDEPAVVELMQPQMQATEITYIAGDFNKELPAGPFDVAFLGNITHIIGKKHNIILIKKVFDSLRPGGQIVILDMLRDMSPRGPLFAVNMLVNTDYGGTWTKDEYFAWLFDAGFKQPKVIDLKERQLVIANK